MVVGLWFGVHVAWTLWGSFNADEGFYALASQRVAAGWVPYADFAYTQMPLLPYLNAPGYALFGYSIGAGRLLSSLWLIGSALLLVGGARRVGGRAAGNAALLLATVACVPGPFFLMMGKTYAAGSFLLLATAWALLARTPARAALAWIVLTGTLAIGTRLTLAPAVLVLWGGFFLAKRRELARTSVGLAALVPLVGLGGFFVYAPENTWFWTYRYHVGSLIEKFPAKFWGECIVFLVGLLPLSWLVVRRLMQDRFRSGGVEILIWFAGGVGIVTNAIIVGTYGEYFVPFFGLVVLGSVGFLWRTGRARAGRWAIGIGASTALMAFGLGRLVPLPLYEQFELGSRWSQLRAAANFLAAHTAPDAQVGGSMVEVPLAAGRAVAPGFEMGKFSVTSDLSEEAAAAVHLIHWNELLRRATEAREPAWVMSTASNWSFGFSVPRMTLYPEAQYRQFVDTLLAHYDVAFGNDTYLVLLRKPVAPGPTASPTSPALPVRGTSAP